MKRKKAEREKRKAEEKRGIKDNRRPILFLLSIFLLLNLIDPLSLSGEEKRERFVKKNFQEKEEYAYTSKGKVDPFKPSITLDILKRRLMPKGPVLPLQTYELSQLKVVAIIMGFEHPRALLEDAAGKGYIVKEGIYVGKNNGRLIKILPNKLIVLQEYLDHYGKIKTKKIALELHKKGGGESK